MQADRTIHDQAFTGIQRRVSWGAIFAGGVIAVAVLLLLMLLGAGIGLASIDPASDSDPLSGLGTGSGIYLIVAQLIALLIGGYAAGRLAGVPFSQGSLLHGVAVWALATFAMFWLATTSVGAIVGGSASIVSKAGKSIASATEAAIPDDMSFDQMLPDLSVSDLPPEMQDAMRRNDLTPQDLQQDVRQIATDTISPEQRQRATDILTSTGKDILTSPGDAGSDVKSMADQLFGGDDAVFNDQDVQQMQRELSQKTGISEAEAKQVYERYKQQAEQAVNDAEQKLRDAKAQAAETAEKAADTVSKAAFAAFVASLLGLIAAAIGAVVGRPKDLVSEYS